MAVRDLSYPRPVRRLRLQRRRGRWIVVKSIEIPSMTLPRSLTVDDNDRGPGTGAWLDACTSEGEVVYRRPIDDPDAFEVPDEGGRFTIHRAEGRDTILDVLMPDLPEIDEVRLYVQQRRGGKMPEPMAVVPMRDQRRGRQGPAS